MRLSCIGCGRVNERGGAVYEEGDEGEGGGGSDGTNATNKSEAKMLCIFNNLFVCASAQYLYRRKTMFEQAQTRWQMQKTKQNTRTHVAYTKQTPPIKCPHNSTCVAARAHTQKH